MAWEVQFYQTERGESPVDDFLERLPEKARAKCISYMLLLEDRGNTLPANFASKVEGDLWELRPEFGGIEYRYFYFTFVENRIVIVHAISKKTQKLKSRDINTAQKRITEVREREAVREAAIEEARKNNADPRSVQITPAIRRRTDRE